MDAVEGTNDRAPFTLKLRRGEGMALLSMDWREGRPPDDFVGFAIQYREPGSPGLKALHNRLTFEPDSHDDDAHKSTVAPIQQFRWVHFPFNAEREGKFSYVVTPMFMDQDDALRSGEAQTVEAELAGEVSPGFDVAFTRGFVSSQAFVDLFAKSGPISTLLPGDTVEEKLDFVPTHHKAEQALEWMGFGARRAILSLVEDAVADPTAEVRVVAYDLDVPVLVELLEQLGPRLRIIIDKSDKHGLADSSETAAAGRLETTAGEDHVARRDADGLQHNKYIAVRGKDVKRVVFGSTNFSWRGFYVQNNHAVVARGAAAVNVFFDAFDQYWDGDSAGVFGATANAEWTSLAVDGMSAQVTFSPHGPSNVRLADVAADIARPETESVFYSLAFLYQTPGQIREALKGVMARADTFVYGVSDKGVEGMDVAIGDNPETVSPAYLHGKDVPEPFRGEPAGGGGNRLHHKFIVLDAFTPRARVYAGSYNFSIAADTQNGENLVLIKDARVATAFTIETLRIFDHYRWRLKVSGADGQARAVAAGEKPDPLLLSKPPRQRGDVPWWLKHYDDPIRRRDRRYFA